MPKPMLTAALLVLTALVAAPAAAQEPVKVVYHLNEGIPQATRAIQNVRNHLSADPSAKIVVVAHGAGIDFLLKDAKDTNGTAFSNHIDELSLRGIEFRICQFTLERRNIEAARVVPEAKIVRSGVAEVSRVQAREGYVYLKP